MKTPDSFIKELLDKIQQQAKDNAYKPNPYRASSAGECARKLAYMKLYPDEVMSDVGDPRVISLLDLGNTIHDSERKLYTDLGYTLSDVESTVEYKLLMDDMTELTINGKIDGKLNLPEEVIPFDIKTASDASFKKVLNMGLPYAYKAQAQVYLDSMKAHKMWFIFYNKNTSDRAVIEYLSDPNMSYQVAERFRQVYNATESNIPAREYIPYRKKEKGKQTQTLVLDSHCAQCVFKDRCYPEFKWTGTHYTCDITQYTGTYKTK